jgi:hypothetical protein
MPCEVTGVRRGLGDEGKAVGCITPTALLFVEPRPAYVRLLHLRPLLGGFFPGDPGGVSHNPPLCRRRYCEALGGILVEFLEQQTPMDAECFADLNATTAVLV